MIERFVKQLGILNPDSEIAIELGVEAPTLVSSTIDDRLVDEHGKSYGPLIYGIGRTTFAENYCPGTCESGIWLEIYDEADLGAPGVYALSEIGAKKNQSKMPFGGIAVCTDMVTPYEILSAPCVSDSSERLSEGYLVGGTDRLYPACHHHSDETRYKFSIVNGEILYHL